MADLLADVVETNHLHRSWKNWSGGPYANCHFGGRASWPLASRPGQGLAVAAFDRGVPVTRKKRTPIMPRFAMLKSTALPNQLPTAMPVIAVNSVSGMRQDASDEGKRSRIVTA